MSPEPKKVSEAIHEENLGSLCGCLVEGDAEQRRRERGVRRRALAISIFVQSAVLAALILVPLFGKTQRIALAYATPIPPYSPYRNAPRNPGAPRPHPSGPQTTCHFCPPTNIPPNIVTRDSTSSARQTDDTPLTGIGDGIPSEGEGFINLSDPRRTVLPPPHTERQVVRPQILHVTRIDPAMLIRRVEPVYPTLAKQTHREGRVELRAIIGTDGRIESLQIVSGDTLFLMSAREAVEQWRYKPTYLNGQAVEIDTFITVVYTMQH
jgi:periplasmic protein TonB